MQIEVHDPDTIPELIKIGSTYYTPLVAVNDHQSTESAGLGIIRPPTEDYGDNGVSQNSGYSYKPPKEAGYSYPVPTRPPPIAEENTEEPEDQYSVDKAVGVNPDREAVFPTRPDAIGLEVEQDIESVGIVAETPRPVVDHPNFEIKRGT